MFWSTPDPKQGSAYLGDPLSLSEFYDANLEAVRRVDLENAAQRFLELEYDSDIDKLAAAGGRKFDNPYRINVGTKGSVSPDSDWRKAAVEQFHKDFYEEASKYPDLGLDATRTPFHRWQEKTQAAEASRGEAIERSGIAQWNKVPAISPTAAFVYNVFTSPYTTARLAGASLRGMVESPTDIVATFIGFTAGGKAASLVKNLGYDFLGNMAAQAFLEGQVQANRKLAGLSYGWKQAMENIATAGATGAVIGATFRGANRVYRGARGQPGYGGVFFDAPNLEREKAVEVISKAAKVDPETVTKAIEGDPEALKQLLEKSGALDDPVIRGASQAAEIESTLPGVDTGRGLRALEQMMRSAVEPDEPLSVRVPDSASVKEPWADIFEEPPLDSRMPVLEIVRSAGGVIDEGGELKAMFDKPGTKGHIPGLISKTGVPVDTLRERLVQEGWLPQDATVADVIDLIDQARSRPKQVAARFDPDEVLNAATAHQRATGVPLDLSRAEEAQLVHYVRNGMTVEDAHERVRTIRALRGDIMTEGTLPLMDSAVALRTYPELMAGDTPDTAFLNTAMGLAHLSEDAFALVQRGLAAPEVAAVVANHVADPDLHAALVRELAELGVTDPSVARQVLLDLMPQPDHRAINDALLGSHVDPEQRNMPARAGAEVDDPSGPAAKAQREALAQELAPEIEQARALGPVPSAALSTSEKAAGIARVHGHIERTLRDGKAVGVSRDIIDAAHAAAAPYAHMLPPGTEVGSVESIRRRVGGKATDVNITWRLGSGQVVNVDLPVSVIFESRALYDRESGHILYNFLSRREVGDIPDAVATGIYHEAVHAWWRRLSPSVRSGLVAHAEALGVLDMQLGTVLKAIGHWSHNGSNAHFTLREMYSKIYRNTPDLQDRLQQESVAHLHELMRVGFFDSDPTFEQAFGGMRTAKQDAVDGVGQELEVMLALSDRNIGQSMRRDLDQLGYYSKALEAARSLKQAKGTPEQMLAQLKAAGVKDAEIEATKLRGALEGKHSVTRDEIVKHLEENRVGLKESVYGTPEANKKAGDEWAGMSDLFGTSPETLRAQNSVSTKWSPNSLDPSNPTYRETVLHLPAQRRMSFDDYKQAYLARYPETKATEQDIRGWYESGKELPTSGSSVTRDDVDVFRSGHFPEPNIVGHMQSGLHGIARSDLERLAKIPGWDKIVKKALDGDKDAIAYVLHQIQSDWGQKLRDGGVRDEAKIADLQARLDAWRDGLSSDEATNWRVAVQKFGKDNGVNVGNSIGDHVGMRENIERLSVRQDKIGEQAREFSRTDPLGEDSRNHRLLRAELEGAKASAPGHPLVNTTDQWTNTTLRRAIRQAVEADADFIAIPHGDTVLSYNPGDTHGMRSFYGSRNAEGIVPKNLRKLIAQLDKNAPAPVRIEKLETTKGSQGWQGDDGSVPTPNTGFDHTQTGFTIFPLTDTVKRAVMEEGQPMFALGGAKRPASEIKETLPRQITELVEPYLAASRAAEAAGLGVERDATGNITSVVRDGKRYSITRDADGNISGINETVMAGARNLSVARDARGAIAGIDDADLVMAGQQAEIARQAVSALVIRSAKENFGVDLVPERVDAYSKEVLDAALEVRDDPVAAIQKISDIVSRAIDELTAEPRPPDNTVPTPLRNDLAEIDRMGEMSSLVSVCKA